MALTPRRLGRLLVALAFAPSLLLVAAIATARAAGSAGWVAAVEAECYLADGSIGEWVLVGVEFSADDIADDAASWSVDVPGVVNDIRTSCDASSTGGDWGAPDGTGYRVLRATFGCPDGCGDTWEPPTHSIHWDIDGTPADDLAPFGAVDTYDVNVETHVIVSTWRQGPDVAPAGGTITASFDVTFAAAEPTDGPSGTDEPTAPPTDPPAGCGDGCEVTITRFAGQAADSIGGVIFVGVLVTALLAAQLVVAGLRR